jgi:arylsulfatase A-like enzyme
MNQIVTYYLHITNACRSPIGGFALNTNHGKPAFFYRQNPFLSIGKAKRCNMNLMSLLIAWLCLFAFPVMAQPGSGKPNIVVIVLDDARYDMFKANGGPAFFNTPAVDRLTEEGANFKFTGATTSLCTPSRASIYTGLYAHHHGAIENNASPKAGLPYISSILQDNGYKTAFIGKWLLDYHVPDDPIGFDYWAVTDSIEHDSLVMRFKDGSTVYYAEHEAEVYTNLGLNFVENMVPDETPWALFLFYRFPHSPYEPMPGHETLYQQSTINFPTNNKPYTKDFPSYLYPGHLFEGDSTELDQVIRDYYENGQAAEYSVDTVLKYLEQQQILDSTLIIFSSDNGYLLGEHGMEKKVLAYEESLRLPLFVRYPAWFAPGTVVDNEIAANIDIATTLLDAAGIPDTFNMDGVSLHQLAQGQVHRKYFYYENYLDAGNKWLAVRSLDYMYIFSLCKDETEEFFDLNIDPEQNTNLIFDPNYTALVESFRLKLDSLRLATGDTLELKLGKCKLESAYFADVDGDQYGNADIRKDSIAQPVGYVSDTSDCNDNNAAIYPGAIETCNSLDDNCNGAIDEGLFITYYTDADVDTFGSNQGAGISLCNDPGNGFSTNNDDCNDLNAAIHPGVLESCNGIDDNCNLAVDEGLTFETYYVDLDLDLYGDLSSSGMSLCNNPGSGYSENNFDCNDEIPAINPGSNEICNGLDDNCSGTPDEGLVFITYYPDLDNDSYGDVNNTGSTLCIDPGFGFISNNFDCDDTNEEINPAQIEICNGLDDNCSGTADDGLVFETYFPDLDNDSFGDENVNGISLCNDPGVGFVTNNLDCNDEPGVGATINPAATELCNGLDDNCNATADDGLTFLIYYADLDHDNYGADSDTGNSLCNDPGIDFSTNNLDCNDGNAQVNPLVTEICNSIDDNCNGTADDGLVFISYYPDLDNDNYGDLNDDVVSLCIDPGSGYSTNNLDCDDGNALINPAAIETCNSIDDDCSGTADDGLVFVTYYIDVDNDHFGDQLNTGNSLCLNPGLGFSSNNLDCNDLNDAINPGEPEVCNSLDDNCNGASDEGLIFITYYIDLDNDNYGNLSVPGNSLCDSPGIGFSTNNLDCNDGNASINPAAAESCNGTDDNCNGTTDDNLVFITYYTDLDNDSFGDIADSGNSLCNNPGAGYSTNNTDCNDGSIEINPAALEICNANDDNCNGTTDDGLIFINYYADLDGDNFGDLSDVGNAFCSNPGAGFSVNNLDCNDGSVIINPAATESCNGIDDNCNGTADDGLTFTTYFVDFDNDSYGALTDIGISLCSNPGTGFSTNNADCNDGNVLINPSSIESCNGLDDNCNGTADDGLTFTTYYLDSDNDSYGALTDIGISLCNNPGTGFSTNNADCNDGSAFINPAATESCNGIDDNCNGTADDGLTFITYYTDLDNDNFGDLTDAGTSLCNNPGFGFSTNNADCNDTSALINPSAAESCNGIDDNCNGTADDGLIFITYYPDLDNDSFGDLADFGSSLCNNPGVGFSTNNTDCNDASALINPTSIESCNGLDDNCNGTTDDGLIFTTYYLDFDHDNYGDQSTTGILFCNDPGSGFSINNLDCNDATATINPASIEFCNAIDDNCNSTADEGLVFITYFADVDHDNFGDQSDTGNSLCNDPGFGYSINNLDCNDNPADGGAINPASAESCNGIDDNCNTAVDDGVLFVTYYLDADSDGFGDWADGGVSLCDNPGIAYATNNGDCNDTNNVINPSSTETCNQVDDNCNGATDDGLLFTTYYPDQDSDGFGDLFITGIALCSNPGPGFIDNNNDCYDFNNAINPSATESCNSLDDNCNGATDEGLSYITYYTDTDNDGYGNISATGVLLCSDPGIGYVDNNSDCNDGISAVNPGQTEDCNGIDDNCNASIDEGLLFITYYTDLDNDSYGDAFDPGISLCSNPGTGFATNNTDCNDIPADGELINPAAAENCNGIDDNCNGTSDDGLAFVTYYFDQDNDSFGDLLDSGNSLCINPGTNFSINNTDCNDGNISIHPSASETCNGVDDNCNVIVDEGLVFTIYYADADNDGFGDLSDIGSLLCTNPGPGFTTNNTDCNDQISTINPVATESCNGIDDNCNFSIDDAVGLITYYADTDGDGFGNAANHIDSCAQPDGYILDNTDCNDSQETINPAAVEVCNGIDDNCNTTADEGLFLTYYPDEDGDGFGNEAGTGTVLCSNPGLGFSTDNTDCNDSPADGATIYPAATEVCNGLDDNCNTVADEGLIFIAYYADADDDGYGSAIDPGNFFCENPGAGFVTGNDDCNDNASAINPAALEQCNAVDDNCNGTNNDGLTFVTYFIDLDNDGYGDLQDAGNALCSNPGSGYSTTNSDCNDNSAIINPGMPEACNGIDDDCDAITDDGLDFSTYYPDQDNDGYGDFFMAGSSLCNDPGNGFADNNDDCYDVNPTINPGAIEICNGIDDNCNGNADDGLIFITYYADFDNDGFGSLTDTGNPSCSNPGTGFSINNTDCNDANATINPIAIEDCNGIDDNCNGTADEGMLFINYFADLDNDSYGDLTDAGILFCSNPGVGYSTNAFDCNDGNALINPSVQEICNGIDDNCNGTADDGLIFITYYADLDNDNFGDLFDIGLSLCNNPGAGFSTNNADCNDGNIAINPSAIESCNGIDDNCNGTADDGLIFITYYTDLDNDSFGDIADIGNSLCLDPGFGFSTNNADCNDGNIAINPSAIESCNGIDDNCNGTADDGLVFITYYVDLDNDSYGDLTDIGNSLCNNPGAGFSTNNADCNDGSIAINPAAIESCNGIDDNCSGTADDGLIFITYYADLDNDSFGDLSDIGSSLCNNPGFGFSTNNADCNDGNIAINPAAVPKAVTESMITVAELQMMD